MNNQNHQILSDTNPHKIQESPLRLAKDRLATPLVHISLRTTLARLLLSTANTSFNLNCKIWTPKTCGFKRMTLHATQLMPHYIFCMGDLSAWSSLMEVMYDLTPLDILLWGFLKLQLYANKPQTTTVFKANVIMP